MRIFSDSLQLPGAILIIVKDDETGKKCLDEFPFFTMFISTKETCVKNMIDKFMKNSSPYQGYQYMVWSRKGIVNFFIFVLDFNLDLPKDIKFAGLAFLEANLEDGVYREAVKKFCFAKLTFKN
jgi:hypothetical protein